MQFIFNGFDKVGHLNTRMENRDNHLAFLKTAQDNNIKLLVVGPILNDNGDMAGSTIIMECDNKQIASDWLSNDPYNKAGLFEKTTLFEYKIVINNF
ncbi:MAG: YciI family protein [Alphaproteobacteria bacterium]